MFRRVQYVKRPSPAIGCLPVSSSLCRSWWSLVHIGVDWTIDFMELPESANGFTRLLVFTDRVFKVAVLAPIRKVRAVEVAAAFDQHVFCWFGMP